MATLNLGRIKPVFRGAYASVAYVVDDIVTHGNETYICIQAHGAGTQATSQTAYWTKLAAKGTDGSDGTDLTSTLTTRGDIVYKGASALTRLPKGTAGYYLKQGANDPEWSAVASGNTVKLAQVEPSANSTGAVTFDNVFNDTTYSEYFVTWDKVALHAGSHAQMKMRFLDSNGTVKSDSNYRWGTFANYWYSSGSQAATDRGWDDDNIRMFGDNISKFDDNYRGWNGHLYIRNPLDTTYKTEIHGLCTGDDGSGASGWNALVHGYYNNNSYKVNRGFTFFTHNNDYFAAGSRWTLYGVKA